jgi:hypothetical protein
MAGIKDTAVRTQHSAHGKPGSTTVSRRRRTKPRRKARRRTETLTPPQPAKSARSGGPGLPPSLISVVTRDGKTTTRQFDGRRFVRFGDIRGKRVAWVEFYTCGSNMHSIAVRFADKTVLHFEITPLFTLKPEYFSLKTGNVEMIKVWPEMKIER